MQDHQLLLPMELPITARTTDPLTSHQAAASVARDPARVRASQTYVLGLLLVDGPATDDELAHRYALRLRRSPRVEIPMLSPSGLRTRRHELTALGKVRDTGERKQLASGRMAIVWAACEK